MWGEKRRRRRQEHCAALPVPAMSTFFMMQRRWQSSSCQEQVCVTSNTLFSMPLSLNPIARFPMSCHSPKEMKWQRSQPAQKDLCLKGTVYGKNPAGSPDLWSAVLHGAHCRGILGRCHLSGQSASQQKSGFTTGFQILKAIFSKRSCETSLKFCHLSWLQTVYTSTLFFSLLSLSTSSKHQAQPKWGSSQGPRYFPQGQGCDSPRATCYAGGLVTLVPLEEKYIHKTVQIFTYNCWEPCASPTCAYNWPTSHVQCEQLSFLPSGKQTKEGPCFSVDTWLSNILSRAGAPVQLQTLSFHSSSFQCDITCDNAGAYFTISFSEHARDTV